MSPSDASIKALEEAKKILETSAQTNRNLFIAFNSVLVTVLILCLSVTDEMLLLGSSTIKLPLLNVDLPIWAFATIAPLALVALHFDLLQNLSAHREKLIAWCKCWFKVYPSPTRNADMPRQLYPFLFDFAWLYANHIESTTLGTRLLPRLCWLLYCWAAYTVLVIFFVRFAELQHYGYTSWHGLLLIFDALILYWYWPSFTQGAKLAAWKLVLAIVIAPLSLTPYLGRKVLDKLKLSRAKLLLLWLSNMVALWTLLLFMLIQSHIDFDSSPQFIKQALEWETTSRSLMGLSLVPRLTLVGFRLTLPDKFLALDKLQQPDKTESQLWQETNNALNLSGRHLAFSDFSNAQLPHSNLRDSKLQGANLWGAQLQGSILSNAYLQYATLKLAQLQGADIRSAHLQYANLFDTKLQDATLMNAHLQGAFLVLAKLQGANLVSAHLRGANLVSAHLQGAVLSDAQLQYANLKNAKLQGVNLERAKLQGANLEHAELQGTNLTSTELQGANLLSTKLQGAVLIKTQLKGVALSDTKQLALSWFEQLDWQKDYDFTHFKVVSWVQLEDKAWWELREDKYLLGQIQQRLQTFMPLQLPPANKKDFTTAWLELLCKDTDVTKRMLRQLTFDYPITKTQAQQYLNSQEALPNYFEGLMVVN